MVRALLRRVASLQLRSCCCRCSCFMQLLQLLQLPLRKQLPPSVKPSTSSRVTSTVLASAVTCAMSTPCSRASLRTLGVARTSRFGSVAAGRCCCSLLQLHQLELLQQLLVSAAALAASAACSLDQLACEASCSGMSPSASIIATTSPT